MVAPQLVQNRFSVDIALGVESVAGEFALPNDDGAPIDAPITEGVNVDLDGGEKAGVEV